MEAKASRERGPKPHLDREVFVEAGLRLASRPNRLTLTYRDLGKEIRVDPTAIYRHFRSKESLMQELLDRVLTHTCERTSAPVERWEERLVEFAEATLDVFLEYPAIAVTATSLTTNGPGELSVIELMLACFAQAGLEGRELAEQYAIYGSYVLASAAGLVRDHVETPEDESGSFAWFAGPLSADPERHSHVAAIREDILAIDQREMFLAGARQIIAAAKMQAGDRAGTVSEPAHGNPPPA
ncbi:TetR/AcrR family transcriptional regulator [Paeniglutamicibacter psychrophenolicus]|uniref:AcrR family transcriptional regulator n=1 Tax=Paeniglutamicibacter psychrophenolicus TaxID=257454 RepID=A0ABS4W9P5_9MICC|nr:TetR/AcrR family transcriptional regulator [Paeniglutamicibacter psychrophenolicus]MBP2372927.1 AcrR family transcriptional regulator [Paeniglutamicibacter psychrophenolicus]